MIVQDSINGSSQTQSFAYDALDRLTQAGASGGVFGNYGPEAYTCDSTTGNLASKAGVTYTYGDPNHKHAVTSLSNGNSYQYDANGNMTRRIENGAVYTQTYDAENRLVQVSGSASAQFGYDGDGNRILATEGVTTTVYIGNYFEWATGNITTTVTYYYAGTTRVAMRKDGGAPKWLLGDHLGSTSVVYDGSVTTSQGYKAWGEKRYPAGASPLPTTFRYTGQREDSYITNGLAGQGVYWLGSRLYDPFLGRFLQPDAIVPGIGEDGNPNAIGYLDKANYSSLTVDYHESQFLEELNQENWNRFQDPDFKLPPVPTNVTAFDRYAYSLNNPIRYVDPSGHFAILALLAAIPPLGLVVLGVTAVAVCVYFAVPEVRPAVTNAISQAGQSLSDAVSEFAKKKDIQDIEYLLDKHGITDRATRRRIHDQITKQGLTLGEIENLIEEEARLSKKDKPSLPPIEPEEEEQESGEE